MLEIRPNDPVIDEVQGHALIFSVYYSIDDLMSDQIYKLGLIRCLNGTTSILSQLEQHQ